MSQKQTTLLATEVIYLWQHNVMLLVPGRKTGHNADTLPCRAALLPGWEEYAISKPCLQSFAYAKRLTQLQDSKKYEWNFKIKHCLQTS